MCASHCGSQQVEFEWSLSTQESTVDLLLEFYFVGKNRLFDQPGFSQQFARHFRRCERKLPDIETDVDAAGSIEAGIRQ